MSGVGTYDRCPICKQWGWGRLHVCPPQWSFRIDLQDWEDVIYASDAARAAERVGEMYDQEDSYLVRDPESATIEVRIRPWSGEVDWSAVCAEETTWVVHGELVPQYHAMEKKLTDEPK